MKRKYKRRAILNVMAFFVFIMVPSGLFSRKPLSPLHASSEFYYNDSLYVVAITLPENYVVGTRGLILWRTRPETTFALCP
jgi:hypothetical protein